MDWDVCLGVATLGLGEWQDGIGKSPESCRQTARLDRLEGEVVAVNARVWSWLFATAISFEVGYCNFMR